jgi:alkylated DNA nucleotide flippase Atl1
MTSEERAQQFWSVLVFAAREQKVVSYEMLSQMTGMANTSGRELGHILYYCKHNKLPLLNLLAVSKDSGKPGDGCPADLSDSPAQQARVFVYDWLKHGVPKVEEFEAARAAQEKSKVATAV